MSPVRPKGATVSTGKQAILSFVCCCLVLTCTGTRRSRHTPSTGELVASEPAYALCVAAVFKNEQDNLAEWLQHYLAEGAGHIFLVNNNSTDSSLEVVRPYEQAGLVSLWTDARRHAQDALNSFYFLPVARQCQWLAVVDLDEFIYARQLPTTAEYLQQLPPTVGCVVIPWKLFGSSGHVVQPAEGVLRSFTHRERGSHPQIAYRKNILRPRAIGKLDLHWPEILPEYTKVFPIGALPSPTEGKEDITEAELDSHALHLNHYRIQSKEWYNRVKIPRGDNVVADWDNMRDANLFAAHDNNEVVDVELKVKVERKLQG